VQVETSSINGHDVIVRTGGLKMVSGRKFPIGTGLDFAAQYVVVPADRIAPAPEGIPSAEAASLPVAGTTALIALRDSTHLTSGERVLVRGGPRSRHRRRAAGPRDERPRHRAGA